MRAHVGTYPAEFFYSNSRPHKCRTRNYVSTSAENGPAMAGPAGPVPAPMSLLSFCSVQSSLAVREFRAAGEEHYKRGHGWVCANLLCLMLCRSTDLRTLRFTTPGFSMVGGFTENLKNHKMVKIGWGGGGGGGGELAQVWALARDNTVIFWPLCIIY